jgi:hypothetical protein
MVSAITTCNMEAPNAPQSSSGNPRDWPAILVIISLAHEIIIVSMGREIMVVLSQYSSHLNACLVFMSAVLINLRSIAGDSKQGNGKGFLASCDACHCIIKAHRHMCISWSSNVDAHSWQGKRINTTMPVQARVQLSEGQAEQLMACRRTMLRELGALLAKWDRLWTTLQSRLICQCKVMTIAESQVL